MAFVFLLFFSSRNDLDYVKVKFNTSCFRKDLFKIHLTQQFAKNETYGLPEFELTDPAARSRSSCTCV